MPHVNYALFCHSFTSKLQNSMHKYVQHYSIMHFHRGYIASSKRTLATPLQRWPNIVQNYEM